MTSVCDPARVRSTRPRVAPVGGRQRANASDCTALAEQVKAAGLLQRRRGSYALRMVLLAALGVILLVTVGRSWWQLLVAVYFSILFAQAVFLAHDGAHKQIFASSKTGETASRLIGNLVVELSYGRWMHKHTRHHGNTNIIGDHGPRGAGLSAYR